MTKTKSDTKKKIETVSMSRVALAVNCTQKSVYLIVTGRRGQTNTKKAIAKRQQLVKEMHEFAMAQQEELVDFCNRRKVELGIVVPQPVN